MIAVIDYGLGNTKSITSALETVGAQPILTHESKKIMDCDALILPGVGSFPTGVDRLNRLGLISVINDFAHSTKPVLGICLGMQLLCESSEEFGHTKGLGLIKGGVKPLELAASTSDRLPHVGWSDVHVVKKTVSDAMLFRGVSSGSSMYFTHSFVVKPVDESQITSTTIYANDHFCSSVQDLNIYGCQFHPEKSAINGLKLMTNFLQLSQGVEID